MTTLGWWLVGGYAVGVPIAAFLIGVFGEDPDEHFGFAFVWPVLLLLASAGFPAWLGSRLRKALR